MTYVLCCSAFTASFTCGFLPQWIAKSVDGSVVLWTAEYGGRPSAPRHTTIPQSSSLVLDQMPGYHMPDGQIEVIEYLEQLVARYPSFKGYAINSMETQLHIVS